MENFTPISSTIGGVLIGLSAVMLMLFHGRIAGISGIFSGLLAPKPGEIGWRSAFVLGLVVAAGGMALVDTSWFDAGVDRSVLAIAAAGLLVGFGTRLGGGCTSGHGICGISRLSRRSIVATLIFMATGVLIATVVTQMFGGTI